jgi:hypothetical protein
MPRVPTYDNFQTLPSTLPQVRVQAQDMPDVAGEQARQVGRAMTTAGSELSRIALDAAQQANQVRINDAMNKAVEAKLKLTYDPDGGFVHLKGDAALTRPDGKPLDQEYGEKFDQQVEAISATLGNDAQRLAFRQQTGQLRQQLQGSLTSHVAREFGDYQVGVQQGTIATAQQQMALAWGDAEALSQSVGAIKAATAEQGRIRGWAGQQIQAAMVDALSPGHAAVVTSAIDAGKLDYARQYMKDYNAELTPQARLQLTKTLDAGDFETRTQGYTEQYLAQAGGDPAKALALAREKLTGKDEDAVVTRIKAFDAEQVALRERAQRTAADAAWKYVAAGKAPPPSVMAALDGRDALQIRKTLAEGPATKTDPTMYYALTQAAVNDPNFVKEDLRRYSDKLTPADFKHFVDLQAKVSKTGDADQVATVTQQKDAIIKSLELKGEKAGLFMQQADRALFAAQQEKGRPLDQGERQKVLDRLVLEGTVPGSVWGTNGRRAYEAQAEGKPFTPKFNDADRRKATAALERQGIKNPTKEQIEATLRAVYKQ